MHQLPPYGSTVTTAQKILIISGAITILYGMVLGVPLAGIRGKQPVAPRALVNAHLGALIQGAVQLGLAVAVGFADLTPWVATAGAVLLAAGSLLETSGGTVNWRQGVTDQFAERSLGWRLNATSGPISIVGAAIVAVGAILAL